MTLRRWIQRTSLSIALIGLAGSAAASQGPSWRPEASERLIKLPSPVMARSIERDFQKSSLGQALVKTRDDAALKAQTLRDLQAAAGRAEDSDLRIELRHQYLAEKRDFIALVGEQQALQRRRIRTRRNLYAKVLQKLEKRGQGITPETQRLLDDQEAAVERFESNVSKVDMALFGSGFIRQSRYASAYAKNIEAIEKLNASIQAHPMNSAAQIDGSSVSKQDYLRHLLTEAESDLAILDQEDQVLGFMAKLVALDAMALAEGIEDPHDLGVGDDDEEQGILVSVVDLFTD